MIDALEFILAGGTVVWLLLGFSIISFSVIIAKLAQLFYLRDQNDKDIDQAIDSLSSGFQHSFEFSEKGSRASIFFQLMEILTKQNMQQSDAREECYRVARVEVFKLSKFLKILEVIATLSPLLGLFGTVLGMIEAFQSMEVAGQNVNPGDLSGGIWKALLTTAVGLAVAIPASICLSWFERVNEVKSNAIQNDVEKILSHYAKRSV